MTPKRLNEIKLAWIGKDNNGLAIKGNVAYRMVAELIDEVERMHAPASSVDPFREAKLTLPYDPEMIQSQPADAVGPPLSGGMGKISPATMTGEDQ